MAVINSLPSDEQRYVEKISSDNITYTFTRVGGIVVGQVSSGDSVTVPARGWTALGTLTKCLFEKEMSMGIINGQIWVFRCNGNSLEVRNPVISSRTWIQGSGVAVAR